MHIPLGLIFFFPCYVDFWLNLIWLCKVTLFENTDWAFTICMKKIMIKVFLASKSIIQMSNVFTFFPISGKPTLFKKPHLIFLAKFEKIYFNANKKIKKYNALDFWQAMFHNGCTKEQLSDIMSFLK